MSPFRTTCFKSFRLCQCKNWDLENVSIISGRALKKLIQLNLVNSTLAIGVYKVMMTATGFKLLEPLNFRLDQS